MSPVYRATMLNITVDVMCNAECLWKKKNYWYCKTKRQLVLWGCSTDRWLFTERCNSWLAFGGARPIFQEIDDIQFYRSLELADVNCNFSCTVTYYFLDGINLASTWCSIHDKHCNVEDMLQIMEFLNIGWSNLVLQMYERSDLTSRSVCFWLHELE